MQTCHLSAKFAILNSKLVIFVIRVDPVSFEFGGGEWGGGAFYCISTIKFCTHLKSTDFKRLRVFLRAYSGFELHTHWFVQRSFAALSIL